MSVDLTEFATVDSELAATADYDVSESLSKAQRRVAALRRKLDFAQSSSNKDGKSMTFHTDAIREQITEVLSWISAQSPGNNVIHADFSGFGQYSGGDFKP